MTRLSFSGLPGLQYPEVVLERTADGRPGEHPGMRGHAFHAIELPPGRSVLHIRCTPPDTFVPFDYRKHCYVMKDFRLVER